MDNCHARDQRTADIAGHGKNYFDGENVEKEEIFPIGEDHPQKEKVEAMRQLFRNFAEYIFMECRYKKEYLSSGKIERILTDANDRLCK